MATRSSARHWRTARPIIRTTPAIQAKTSHGKSSFQTDTVWIASALAASVSLGSATASVAASATAGISADITVIVSGTQVASAPIASSPAA
ncbi:MAG: hypothetical protein BWZ07_02996 [Alphaproteobacteria bacterium ADurb.BinA280]|nr:MAG: hypothetical protein BWZ07_02996 [Alphaproteobacteria bacterium ADurb.BinA280]